MPANTPIKTLSAGRLRLSGIELRCVADRELGQVDKVETLVLEDSGKRHWVVMSVSTFHQCITNPPSTLIVWPVT